MAVFPVVRIVERFVILGPDVYNIATASNRFGKCVASQGGTLQRAFGNMRLACKGVFIICNISGIPGKTRV